MAAANRFQSPNSLWSAAAKTCCASLGVDVRRFETAFDRKLYASLGLSRGVFFAREAFGRDRLVRRRCLTMAAQRDRRRLANARTFDEFVADIPISDASKAQLLALYDDTRDPLAGRTIDEKMRLLKPRAIAII